ncbi:MAG: nitrite/sulfite reductase [Actinomycetia bacterium]|nr:nitrite/sulfite reductase [Actinomycetes bacterium]
MTTIEIDTGGDVDIDSIDPGMVGDIRKFERVLARYLADEVDEDVFKVFRLANGVYGQRQGGHNQMLRIKAPYGAITADQLDRLAAVSERYSRGWGHLTTRQNVQFHYVQLEEVPSALWDLAAVNLTTREACSDTVRNVMGCHLAGACPNEVLDIQPWAEAAFRHFLRNPISARLPRKFKINFSGCVTDCGQAMFNDVGVIAINRTADDGTTEPGFRVYVAGGLGANPHPAVALEDFTTREELLATLEACVRVFEQAGNRKNKLRARMKWLVDELGIDELRDRVLTSRKFLMASATWPEGIPPEVELAGDTPAGHGTGPVTAIGQGVPVTLSGTSALSRWDQANVVRGVANGTVSALAWSRLGDVTADQFRGIAALAREVGAEVRITNRQNFVLRQLSEDQLALVHERLESLGMAQPGAELARDVVACPGADTCNLAITQSRGLASAIGEALEAAGLAELDGVRTNISGCTNSCGQHHIADIGFFGAERRAHGRSAPGYQMLLGGYIGNEQAEFGRKALRLPAKSAPEAAVRVIGRYANEREVGEAFGTWLERVGGATTVAQGLSDLDVFPTPEDNEDFYVDYGETGPYEAEVGDSECAV